MLNRRAYRRREITLPAEYQQASYCLPCETKNISLGGVCLKTEDQLAPGTKVRLRLQTPTALVLTMAEIVHCEPGAGLGLKFLHLPPIGQQALTLLLHHTEACESANAEPRD